MIALDLNKAITTLKTKLDKSVDGAKYGLDVVNAGKAVLTKCQGELARFCESKFTYDSGRIISKIGDLTDETTNHDGATQLSQVERDGIDVGDAREHLTVFIAEDYGSSVLDRVDSLKKDRQQEDSNPKQESPRAQC